MCNETIQSRIPDQIIRFAESGMMISDLVGTRAGYSAADYPWAKRMLGKFPIPHWQRDSKWPKAKKISFIESIYYGYDLGFIVVNGHKALSGDRLAPLSDCLIDGQQRIGSAISYTNDEFKVFGLLYSELTRQEQARFLYREIGKKQCDCFDEEKLKRVSNHLNFSGMNHLDSERA